MTLDDIEVIPETGFTRLTGRVTGLLSFDQWAYAAVALIVLFVLAYIAYYYLRYSSHKRLAFIFSMICLIMSVMALSMAFIQHNAFKNEQPAIVFATETRVMSEPNTRGSEAFVLHEGTKVQVLDQLNDWKKIRLADGSTGWIPGKDIKLLKDF